MIKYRELPIQEFLLECFEYDGLTGMLYWKHRLRSHFNSNKVYNWWNGRFEGKLINNLNKPSGYKTVALYQKKHIR